MIFEKIRYSKAKKGDTRILPMYALTPVTVLKEGKEYIALFEHYYEHQIVVETHNLIGDSVVKWKTTKRVLK